MSKGLAGLAIALILGFVVVIGLLLSSATQRPAEAALRTGGVERAVAAADDSGLRLTAVSPMDAYGEEYVAAAAVCPGMNAEMVTQQLQLTAAPEGLEGAVDEDENYLLLIRADGSAAVDHLNRSRVDLCAGQALPLVNAAQMIPLGKTSEGGWVLAI